MRKALILGVAGAMVVAVPAVAKPGTHPSNSHKPVTPHGKSGTHGKSHKCATHKVGYTAGGDLVSITAGTDSQGNATDAVVLTVKHANHHANKLNGGSLKGSTLTETVPASEVTFEDGLTAATATAGDNVQVIGKVTEAAKKCTSATGTGVVTIKKIVVSAPDTSGTDTP